MKLYLIHAQRVLRSHEDALTTTSIQKKGQRKLKGHQSPTLFTPGWFSSCVCMQPLLQGDLWGELGQRNGLWKGATWLFITIINGLGRGTLIFRLIMFWRKIYVVNIVVSSNYKSLIIVIITCSFYAQIWRHNGRSTFWETHTSL